MTVDKMIKWLESEYGMTTTPGEDAEKIIAKLHAAELLAIAADDQITRLENSNYNFMVVDQLVTALNGYERAGEGE